MRLLSLFISTFMSTAAVLIAAEIQPGQPGGLTVHEWGTFTSVAGENGSPVEWDTLGCSNDLPRFVNDYGYRGFKWRLQGTVRMETPVMYFYSARELTASVKVSFPGGLITEWYPRAEYNVDQGGARLPRGLDGIDFSMRTTTGVIEWNKVKIEPHASPVLPVERAPNRYYAARETDAAPLTVGDQNEKFLFYRGVGRFPIPLSARVLDGKITVENHGTEPVPGVILFENRGGQMGYRIAGSVAKAVALDRPPLVNSAAELRRHLEASLTANGLYPKEAHAMVETWQDSWFEEGSRLIYIVPAGAVNAFLPAQIEPAPSRMVRVFVGRIELITPETQRAVQGATANADYAAVAPYNRFIRPILSRVYSGNSAKANDVEGAFRAYQRSTGVSCR